MDHEHWMMEPSRIEEQAAMWYLEWPCPVCQGGVESLGMLGRLVWGRCISCGIDCHMDLLDEPIDIEGWEQE